MATYVVQRDDYAGWNTGRLFGLFGLAAGAVSAASWAAMHGVFPGIRPAMASDQILLGAMIWVGGGVFAVMTMCVLGSLMISDRSQGAVIVSDAGVERQIGGRSRTLAWNEIEGFVAMPYGGVTLVEREGAGRIRIPRSLDDYRGCIAEIKARGVRSLSSSRLRRKLTWEMWIRGIAAATAWSFAWDAKESHAARIISASAAAALAVWMAQDDEEDGPWARRFGVALTIAVGGLMLYHMRRTW